MGWVERCSSGRTGSTTLSDRNFYRIEKSESLNTWTIWDKEGNKYTFGLDTNSRLRYPRYGSIANGCPYTEYTWKWGLSEVEKKFGQKLSYSYAKDTKTVTTNPCPGQSGDTKPADLALYPETITYPHNRYRVLFVREGRTDYDSHWWSDSAATTFFHRYRLDKVQVQHDPDGSGSQGWTTIRAYDLSYDSGSSPTTPGAREASRLRSPRSSRAGWEA